PSYTTTPPPPYPYPLSLHDALPIYRREPLRRTDIGAAVHPDPAIRPRLRGGPFDRVIAVLRLVAEWIELALRGVAAACVLDDDGDRKSTRLNSSHVASSYAVFCLKK